MRIEETACPTCGRVGTLYIEIRMVANPTGSFSIAGAQMKVTARARPFLLCSVCDFTKIGDFDDDNKHVIF